MLTGVLDIGTNTILLLIAEVSADGDVRTILNEQTIVRLGEGVDRTRRLGSEACDRALRTLKICVERCRVAGVGRIIAGATSAVRNAENGEEFLDRVRGEIGLEIRILSGSEEANLTYVGAVSGALRDRSEEAPFTVLDIGGGSTELTWGKGYHPEASLSFEFGCVRLTERYLKHSPPSSEERRSAVEEICRHFHDVLTQPHTGTLIGVAGTVTTLAAMDLALDRYDPDRVTGHALSLARVDKLYGELKEKSLEQIRAYPQILPGRADIILAGVMILREVMVHLGSAALIVSDRGLRYGMALSGTPILTRRGKDST